MDLNGEFPEFSGYFGEYRWIWRLYLKFILNIILILNKISKKKNIYKLNKILKYWKGQSIRNEIPPFVKWNSIAARFFLQLPGWPCLHLGITLTPVMVVRMRIPMNMEVALPFQDLVIAIRPLGLENFYIAKGQLYLRSI